MSEYRMRRLDSRRVSAACSQRVIPLHGIVPQYLGPLYVLLKTRWIAKADQTLKSVNWYATAPATRCNHWLFPAGNSAKCALAPGHLAALTADPALAFSARGEAAQHRATT